VHGTAYIQNIIKSGRKLLQATLTRRIINSPLIGADEVTPVKSMLQLWRLKWL